MFDSSTMIGLHTKAWFTHVQGQLENKYMFSGNDSKTKIVIFYSLSNAFDLIKFLATPV